MKKRLVLLIILSVFISGCVESFDAVNVATQLNDVQALLSEHPNADVKATLWSEDAIERNIEQIRSDCENIDIKDYWKVSVKEGTIDMTIWIDASSQTPVCMVKLGIGEEVVEEEEIEEEKCGPDWNCGEWSKCSEDELQTRICTDVNGCGVVEGKPEEEMECVFVGRDCTDTDGGEDLFVKGDCTWNGYPVGHINYQYYPGENNYYTESDECYSLNRVTEYWCEDGEHHAGVFDCDDKCVDGACVEEEEVVEDEVDYYDKELGILNYELPSGVEVEQDIVFTTFDDGVTIMNNDGSDLVVIHEKNKKDIPRNVGWSPDGKMIALSMTIIGGNVGSHVLLMNADGTEQTEILGLGGFKGFEFLDWNENGEDILVMKHEKTFFMKLYSFNIKTKQLTEITTVINVDGGIAGFRWYHAAWSPDTLYGTNKIAFYGFNTDSSDDKDGRMFIINPDGSEKEDIFNNEQGTPLDWTCDGNYLLYLKDAQLWKVTHDGLVKMKVNNDDEYSFSTGAWSPDAIEIVYQRTMPGQGICTLVGMDSTFLTEGFYVDWKKPC